jgi:hypothetical protein
MTVDQKSSPVCPTCGRLRAPAPAEPRTSLRGLAWPPFKLSRRTKVRLWLGLGEPPHRVI